MSSSASNKLILKADEPKPLSKHQQNLKRLLQRVAALKEELKEELAKREELLGIYTTEIEPTRKALAEAKLKLASCIDRAAERYSFTGQQVEKVGKAVELLCDEALAYDDLCIEAKMLYSKWSTITYNEKQQKLLARAKQMFADMMLERYDVEIDIEDIEDTTEGFAQFRQRMKAKLDEERKAFWEEQSKRIGRAAEKEKREAEIKQRSIRQLYLSLVKVLHPDLEQDEALKLEKIELMKRLTLAYEMHDLQTLIELESNWITNTADSIEAIANEKIKIYIESLKAQVASLEKEKVEQLHQPSYSIINEWASMPLAIALGRIKRHKKEIKEYQLYIQQLTSSLRRADAKTPIIEVAEMLIRSASSDLAEDDWHSVQI